jgi:hypothetical protein
VAFVVVAGFALLSGDPFAQLFTWLSYVAALGVLVLMVGTSVAVVGFFARNAHLPEGVLRTVAAPMVSGLGLVVIAWLTVANSGAMLGGDGSGLRWVFVGLLVLAFGLGLARGTYLHSSRPETFPSLGAAGPVPGGIPHQRDGKSDAFAEAGARRPGVCS